jgi:hypothetical protein
LGIALAVELGAASCAEIKEAERQPAAGCLGTVHPTHFEPPSDCRSLGAVSPPDDGQRCCCWLAPLESNVPPNEIELFGLDEDRRYLWKVLAGGIATFAFGQSLAFAYAATSGRHADGAIDALPIIGPLVVEAHDRPGGGWSSALGLSSFLQASSLMIIAIAGRELADLRVEPGASCSRGGASWHTP